MKTNLFTLITKYLIIFLPFYVLIALFLQNIIGISYAGFFLKEVMLVILFGSLVYEFVKAKQMPKFEILDYLVFAYITYGVLITFYNGLGLPSVLYGGRYDFMFLIVMLLYKHGQVFLQTSIQSLAKLFLLSGGISLFLGFLVKFRLGEDFLTQFGFVMYKGNWIFEGGVPAYHGLEGSGIRRFQGIFDSPSAMGYFLILFSGVFLFLQKKKLDFFVLLMGTFFFILLLITYSRSALLGVIASSGLLFLLYLPHLYKHYKKYFLKALVGFGILIGIMGITFQDKIENIVFRASSTDAHFERMEIGINRFIAKPFGSGLAESGPGFRNIYPEKTTKQAEEYYIPESWFIQVLTEGGIIYFTLFILIFFTIAIRLFQRVPVFFWSLGAIVVMNVFLHIFEATYLSILTFLFIGLFMNKK